MSPEAQLLSCKPKTFKAYLRWRKKHFRIKKQSAMQSYWKRISNCYRHLAGERTVSVRVTGHEHQNTRQATNFNAS
ncbi:hypothetical protein BDV95DRAFT_649794 [Massariosphaeria phaeospora]|uniref:Uncharacterized protein n=1 Tax=Massariosphaeria phaeospora TaxID=100035 RepID=A0A7C8I0Y7_9PLEO|nr:hypothetical protein BDV95DRAFT_649794 [Massariosphaeria phaeospora]